MALHHNLNLFYLLLFISSLLLPPHLAQPEASPSSSPLPSPGPTSSGSSSPSPGPTSSGSSSPLPSPRPTSSGSSSPSPGPTSSGLTPSTAPSSANLIDDGPDIQDFIISLLPSLSNFRSTIPTAAAPSDDSDTIIGIDLSPANAPSPDASIDPKIQKICESTDHPSLCIATVSPYLDGKTDVPSVLGVAIKAGTALSKIGQSMADKLAGDRSQMSSSLDECKEDFDNAVDNFGKALGSLPEQDKGTMNSMLSARSLA